MGPRKLYEHEGPSSSPQVGPVTLRLRSLLRGTSVNAFARESGIPESSLRLYLRGAKIPPQRLAKIAEAKGVRLEWLINGIEPMIDSRSDAFLRGAVARAPNPQTLYGSLMRIRDATDLLIRLQKEVNYELGGMWPAVLQELLLEQQITEVGVRRILEHLKEAL